MQSGYYFQSWFSKAELTTMKNWNANYMSVISDHVYSENL